MGLPPDCWPSAGERRLRLSGLLQFASSGTIPPTSISLWMLLNCWRMAREIDATAARASHVTRNHEKGKQSHGSCPRLKLERSAPKIVSGGRNVTRNVTLPEKTPSWLDVPCVLGRSHSVLCSMRRTSESFRLSHVPLPNMRSCCSSASLFEPLNV